MCKKVDLEKSNFVTVSIMERNSVVIVCWLNHCLKQFYFVLFRKEKEKEERPHASERYVCCLVLTETL